MDLCFDVYCGRSMLPATQNIVRRRVHWLCETSPEGLILDLGCSQGLEALILAYLGKDVIGLDNDALALDWAQRNVLRYPEDIQKRITFVHEDFSLWTTPLHFDGIIAGEYLEHLTDSQLKQHLSKIASLLKEHGALRTASSSRSSSNIFPPQFYTTIRTFIFNRIYGC